MVMTSSKKHFFEQVYEVVRLIPPGRVSSYGAIAEFLGARSASRLVGTALKNSLTLRDTVPAHRVVNRNGLLTGRHHFQPPEKMAALLRAEGVGVKDHQVMDFDIHFWHPRELE